MLQLLLDPQAASPAAFPIDGGGVVESSAGGIAVIDIIGPLVHRNQGILGWIKGNGASYADIEQYFSQAMADEDVSQIILNIDSPGGEVAGAFDLADLIYQARGTKPILAIANESALSAAYLIASAADKVYLTRTASIGSVGVMALHVDQSKAEEKIGLKYTAIYAGARKIDFSPHCPLSEEAFAAATEKINATYDLFVKTVARNRGIPEDAVRKTEAAIYTGADAVRTGLADSMSSFNYLLRGTQMALKTELRALLAGKEPEQVAEALAGVGFVPKDIDQAGQTKEILSIAELAGVTDLAFIKTLIDDGKTPEEARTAILEAKADQAKANIFSTVSATGLGDRNILLESAKKRAGKEQK